MKLLKDEMVEANTFDHRNYYWLTVVKPVCII